MGSGFAACHDGEHDCAADRAELLHLRHQLAVSGGRPVELLTLDEHEALRLSGQLADLLGRIVGDGPTRRDDLAELYDAVHLVQRTVGSQAAARAYPARYRLLGSTIEPPDAEPSTSRFGAPAAAERLSAASSRDVGPFDRPDPVMPEGRSPWNEERVAPLPSVRAVRQPHAPHAEEQAAERAPVARRGRLPLTRQLVVRVDEKLYAELKADAERYGRTFYLRQLQREGRLEPPPTGPPT